MAKVINSDGTIKGTIAAILNISTGTLFLRDSTFPKAGEELDESTTVDFKPMIKKAAAEARVLNKMNNTQSYQERVLDIHGRKTPKGLIVYTRVYYKNKVEAVCKGLPMYRDKATKEWGGVKVAAGLKDTLTANFIIWDRAKPPKWLPVTQRPRVDAKALTTEIGSLIDFDL